MRIDLNVILLRAESVSACYNKIVDLTLLRLGLQMGQDHII